MGFSLAVQNSFHGRTFGAMALTTSKTYYRQGFAPLMPQVVVAPYPYCLHCKVRAAHPEGDNWYKASSSLLLPSDRFQIQTCKAPKPGGGGALPLLPALHGPRRAPRRRQGKPLPPTGL